ncbi:IS66 family insertion sequence element accessory protein TnpB [Lactobacillus helveticus]|uniref:IS66 family insertion sequence element accessory protein TnpB n=1 Tax=Lactobacillus helveticus TaxID=1587 RepID=UPI0027E2E35C|nr:IS66 family insertion sequence element accessory protein TnpB [Lactobacillus helveticus]
MQDNEVLLYKRFENGKMSWPRNQNEVLALSSEQVDWLMKGFAISPKIKNTKACEFY